MNNRKLESQTNPLWLRELLGELQGELQDELWGKPRDELWGELLAKLLGMSCRTSHRMGYNKLLGDKLLGYGACSSADLSVCITALHNEHYGEGTVKMVNSPAPRGSRRGLSALSG